MMTARRIVIATVSGGRRRRDGVEGMATMRGDSGGVIVTATGTENATGVEAETGIVSGNVTGTEGIKSGRETDVESGYLARSVVNPAARAADRRPSVKNAANGRKPKPRPRHPRNARRSWSTRAN
jgi:hypothetical protein